VSKWYKGAKRVNYNRGSGQPLDGYRNARIADVHAEGVYRTAPSAYNLAAYFNSPNGSGPYHFLFVAHGPNAGQLIQMLPADRGAYALGGYANLTPTGNSLNRTGARHVSICVVGVTESPDWDKMPRKAKLEWLKLVRWLKNKHDIQPITRHGWNNTKKISFKRYTKGGYTPHGKVPFQQWRSDGTGNGKPLGITFKKEKRHNLTKHIVWLKKKLGL